MDSVLKAFDSLDSVAVVIASLVALYGISAWKREHVGKKRIELAEEVLELFYALRDIVRDARNDLQWSGALAPPRQPHEGETEQEKRIRDHFHANMYQYSLHQETFNRLEAKRHRFMVYFGQEAQQPFTDLARVMGKIRNAIRTTGRLEEHYHRREMPEKQRQYHQEAVEVMWTHGDDDEISTDLKRIIAAIEEICRPEIERQAGRWARSSVALIAKLRRKERTK